MHRYTNVHVPISLESIGVYTYPVTQGYAQFCVLETQNTRLVIVSSGAHHNIIQILLSTAPIVLTLYSTNSNTDH